MVPGLRRLERSGAERGAGRCSQRRHSRRDCSGAGYRDPGVHQGEKKVFREDSLIAENHLCKGTGVWTRATAGTGRDMCTEQKRRKGPQRELGWVAKGVMPGG